MKKINKWLVTLTPFKFFVVRVVSFVVIQTIALTLIFLAVKYDLLPVAK